MKTKKIALIFSATFAFTFVSLACIPPGGYPIVEIDENTIFDRVEKMPEFPGGQEALLRFLSENIRYPRIEEHQIQGRVVVQFVVNTDGSVTDIQVVRSVAPSLDREAVRIVEAMPDWIPGEQRGKKVRVRYTLPVHFRLQ